MIVQEYETVKGDIYTRVLALQLQNKPHEATEEIAQHIEETERIHTIRHDKSPEVWIYREGVYKPQGATYIKELARKILGESYTTHRANEVLYKVMADTYIEAEDFFKQQEADSHLIPVQNGILNLKTQTLESFTPEKVFFNKIPVEYDTGKDCPQIRQFFKDVLPPEEDRRVLQEWFGFALLREYRYEKALMLHGGGRNGKSKTLELMRLLVGTDNCASISLQELENQQFAVAELHNNLLNVSGDISREALRNTGVFKSATGRDQLTADRKFLQRISFTNYAKFVFSANEIPPTKDLSDAFFARWDILTFPNTFYDQEELEALAEAEREHARLKDAAIIERITTPEEMSGLLNWALEGYKRLAKQGGFSSGASTEEVRINWIRKADSFRAFCMDYLKEDWENEIVKSDLKKLYVQFCRKNKLRIESDKSIRTVLSESYGAYEERSKKREDRARVWIGISVQHVQHVRGVYPLEQISNLPISKNTLDNPDNLDRLQEQFKKNIIQTHTLLKELFGEDQLQAWIDDGTLELHAPEEYRLRGGAL